LHAVWLDTRFCSSADNIRVFLALFEKGTANAVTGEINIFDAVGYMNINTANPESFFVTVSDNVLNLEFANVFSDPQLCGIEIKRAPALAPAAPTAVPPPAPARYRLSSGYSYTATNGDYWEPDTPYVTGGVVSPRPASTAIADTLEDGLYRKERWGTAMKYKLPIKNGAYLVTMHVAELA
jgi:hypothetical protein